MHSKKDIINQIFDALKIQIDANPTSSNWDGEEMMDEIRKYLNQDFMRKYHPPKKCKEQYEQFLVSVAIQQCNKWTHPLTCGVDSKHKLLVPKFDYQGEPYLICPTCGMVQIYKNGSCKQLLQEIYDAANGDWNDWMLNSSSSWAEAVANKLDG